jgi:hypothetical protein
MNLAKMTNADMFKKHLKAKGLVGFGGYQIKTTISPDGLLKKTLGIGIKGWSEVITPDNYENFILTKWTDQKSGQETFSQPKSYYIKTGEKEGIVGIDFDTECAYKSFISSNPECSTYFTQKTKKGFHIIFKYDKRLNHSCSNDGHTKEDCKIDFRSNGGCLISYPTTYKHCITDEVYKYEIHVDGELGQITDKIVKYFDDNKIIYQAVKTDTNSRMSKKKKEVNNEIKKKIESVEEKLEEVNSQSGKLFIKMCACYTKERVSNYSSWFEMGCMLKNHFVNKGKETEGKDCFKYFSKLKDAHGAMFYTNYDVETLIEKWATMEVFKVKKVDKNKSWDKIKKWAKKDDEEKFNAIFDLSELNLTSSYSDLKTAFEETNFKVRNPVGFCEVIEIDGQEELVFRNPGELNTLYENLFWTKYIYKPSPDGEGEGTFEEQERMFVCDWRKDTQLLEYERIDFRPYCLVDTCPDNVYNQFRGFNAIKYYTAWNDTTAAKRPATDTEEGIGLLLQHIRDLCGTPEFYEYFLDWLAFKLQFPSRKNNIATIMKSLQGAGKDSFFDWFGNEILGSKYYLNIQGLSQLENFNALLSCKLLVVLNEFELKESIANKEKFKALITNLVNVINEKNEKMRKEKDHINYALLTNNNISFSIESGDRRITATEANNKICNDKIYFDKLYASIYGRDKMGEYVGKDYIAPFFHFLLQRQVEKKDWIADRVKTEYYKTLQEYAISPMIRFFEYLNNKHYKYGAKYDGKADTINGNKSTFTATHFYNMFKDFRIEWNYRSADWNSVLFGTNLKHYCMEGELESIEPYKFITKKKSGVNCYTLDNKKMIKFLELEGIIETTGVCLIPTFKKDEDEVEEEEECEITEESIDKPELDLQNEKHSKNYPIFT